MSGTHFKRSPKVQRILLARAIYEDPKILALDEATSHLDIASERAVNAAIRSIPLTRIIVAHRPETIAMAQRVIVMDRGKIISDFAQIPSTESSPSHLAKEPEAC